MLPDIPGNFKNKFRKKDCSDRDSGLVCKYCDAGDIMTQSHCAVCPAWQEMRDGLDLTDIRDLVTYFRRLLEERAKMDKMDPALFFPTLGPYEKFKISCVGQFFYTQPILNI